MLVTPHDGRWVSPFGHPRITARLTTPRGLSRPPTSFIGSWCQDIHHVLLHTSPQQDARIHYATLNTQPHPNPHEPPPHPPDKLRDALDGPGQEQPYQRNTNQVSSQDPTVCQAHEIQDCIGFVFHPATAGPAPNGALNQPWNQ
jgi:hypothetical protein